MLRRARGMPTWRRLSISGLVVACLAIAVLSARAEDADTSLPLERISIGDRSRLAEDCPRTVFDTWVSMSRNSAVGFFGKLEIQPGVLHVGEQWLTYSVWQSPKGKPYIWLREPLYVTRSQDEVPARFVAIYYPHPGLAPDLHPCYAAVVRCAEKQDMLRFLSGESPRGCTRMAAYASTGTRRGVSASSENAASPSAKPGAPDDGDAAAATNGDGDQQSGEKTLEGLVLQRLQRLYGSSSGFHMVPAPSEDGPQLLPGERDRVERENKAHEQKARDDAGMPAPRRPLEQVSIGDRSTMPDYCAKSIFNLWLPLSWDFLGVGTMRFRPGRMDLGRQGRFDYEVRHSPAGLPYLHLKRPLGPLQNVGLVDPYRYLVLHYPIDKRYGPAFECIASLWLCPGEKNAVLATKKSELSACTILKFTNISAPEGR